MSTNTIELKLTMDNKEALAALGVTEESLLKLVQASQDLNTVALQTAGQELVSIANSAENATEAVTGYVSVNNLSAKGVNEIVNNLKTERDQLALNSTAYQQLTKTINSVEQAKQSLVTGVQKVKDASGNAQQTISQLGWVMGDAGMFATNFRMGMMSIGNNIPMVVKGLTDLKTETGSWKGALGALTSSIAGPGGILLAANMLMTALQVLPGVLSDSTAKTKELKEELGKLKNDLDRMSIDTLNQKLGTEKLGAVYLQKKAAEEVKAGTKVIKNKEGDVVATEPGKVSVETTEAIQANKDAQDAIRELIGQMGILENLEKKLAEKRLELRKSQDASQTIKIREEIKSIEKNVHVWYHRGEESADTVSLQVKNELAQLDNRNEADEKLLKLEIEMVNRRNALKERYEDLQLLEELYEKKKEIILREYAEKQIQIEREMYEKSLQPLAEYTKKEMDAYQDNEYKILELHKELRLEKAKSTDAEYGEQKERLKIWYEEQLNLLQLNEEGKMLLKQLYLNKVENLERQVEEKRIQRQRSFLKELETSELGTVTATYNARKKQVDELFFNERDKNRALQIIERDRAKGQIKASIDALNIIGAAFGQHTAMYKAAAVAQATWNTWNAANAALDDAPVPLNFALAAAVAGAGLANVAKIISTDVGGGKGTAYATGGFALVGEKGPEIIAPAIDYATGQALLINQVIHEMRASGVTAAGTSGGNVDPALIENAIIKGFANSTLRARGKDLVWVVNRVNGAKKSKKVA